MILSVLHALFLTCSHCKKWKKHRCNNTRSGLSIIHHYLTSYDISISELDLRFNGLTRSSSSFITDLTIHCRMEMLDITGNDTIVEDPTFYNILSHPSSRLVGRTWLAPYYYLLQPLCSLVH